MNAAKNFIGVILFISLCVGCARRENIPSRLRDSIAKYEATLAKNPSDYLALHSLAIDYTVLYERDSLIGNPSAAFEKQKALDLVHKALEKAPLTYKPDLGMSFEKLGYEREALGVYEDFLREALTCPR
jgi:tetratricopeptide (TPR) repeat protein